MSKKIISPLLLVLTAAIWGSAFVAQRSGMDFIEPLTFNGVRCFIGVIALIPVIFFFDLERKRKGRPAPGTKRQTLIGGISCGVIVFAASSLQQIGLQTTDAGKSGFITALYIVIVPVIGLFRHKRQGGWIWIPVAIAVVGMYLLTSGGDGDSFGIGEVALLLSALVYSGHIICVDYFAPKCDCLRMSCMQFLVTGILSIPVALIFEHPSASGLMLGWFPLVYTGVMSCGVAYTLQIFGQRGTPPAVASLIMSLESVFAVLSGALILHETMTATEVIGCTLMFVAIMLSQLLPLMFYRIYHRKNGKNDRAPVRDGNESGEPEKELK